MSDDQRNDLPFMRRRKGGDDQVKPATAAPGKPSDAFSAMFAPKGPKPAAAPTPARNDGPPSAAPDAFKAMFGPKPTPAAPAAPAPAPMPPVRPARTAAKVVPTPRAPRPERLARTDLVESLPGFSGDGRAVLDREAPVVALTRAQSGVGLLTFDLVSDDKSLTLGVVYEDEQAREHVVNGPNTSGGLSTPVSVSRNRTRVTVALRNIQRLDRFLVFITARSADSAWRGAVRATTAADGELLSVIDFPTAHESCGVLTGYVVSGRLVLRAEVDHQDVPLKRLCEDYGYTEVAWRNDRETI